MHLRPTPSVFSTSQGECCPFTGQRPGRQLVRPAQLRFPSPKIHAMSFTILTGVGDGHLDCFILASPLLVSSVSPYVEISSTPTPDIPGTAHTTQWQTCAPRSTDASCDSLTFGWIPVLLTNILVLARGVLFDSRKDSTR